MKNKNAYMSNNCANEDEGHEFCWDNECSCFCHNNTLFFCGICGKNVTIKYITNPQAFIDTPNNACADCRK